MKMHFAVLWRINNAVRVKLAEKKTDRSFVLGWCCCCSNGDDAVCAHDVRAAGQCQYFDLERSGHCMSLPSGSKQANRPGTGTGSDIDWKAALSVSIFGPPAPGCLRSNWSAFSWLSVPLPVAASRCSCAWSGLSAWVSVWRANSSSRACVQGPPQPHGFQGARNRKRRKQCK